ncbi:MAG TPA: Ig-like domain-containing protein [Anaeromyxobacter sp.]
MISRTLNRWTLGTAALSLALLATVQGCRVVTYSVRLTGLAMTPGTASIAATTTQQFTLSGTYSDLSARDVTADAAWSSSDPAVATVSGGIATPLRAGTTTITAALEGHSASSALTVTNALLQSLEVLPANPSIPNGTALQLSATGHFDDGSVQDLTAQAAWTSSDPSVNVGDAAGSKGLAVSTALGAATSTVTATLGAISGSTALTVRDVTLASLTVTPATATIRVGRGQQFAATGTFSDASTHDMTREATWQSSATSVATVGPTGLAMGVFAGTATISATSSALLGSVPGDAQLTVQAAAPGY